MHTGYMPHIDEVMPTILDTGAGIHLVNPTTGHVMGQALPKEVIITDDSQQMQIGGIGGDVMGTAIQPAKPHGSNQRSVQTDNHIKCLSMMHKPAMVLHVMYSPWVSWSKQGTNFI